MPEGDRPRGTGEFMARMKEVRTFFKAFLEDPAQPEGPAFDLAVRFRENPPAEKGGDRIIRWSLASGEQEVTLSKPTPTIPWAYGSLLRVKLEWAKDSPVIPVERDDLPGTRVQGRTAVIERADRWSLLALLRLASIPDSAGDPSLQMLRFVIATRPEVDPEAPPPPPKTDIARVYIRIGVRVPESREKPATGKDATPPPPAEDLKVPVFPVAAPRWTQGSEAP